jgi:GTP-binding protein Era
MHDLPIQSELPPDHRSGFVTLVGRPNVGKSTLLNAFVGQKIAVVSKKPQTTRNRILGILTRPDAQLIFVDTPGIHSPVHRLGEYMVKTAQQAIPDADVVLFIVEAQVTPAKEDYLVGQFLAQHCPCPVILVMNKMDLLPPEKVESHFKAYQALGEFDDWMMISATRGDNLDKLQARVIDLLPQGPRYYPKGQVTDLTERFIASELIREQVLSYLHQEVPHAIAVVIEEFKERRSGLLYLSATIYVEKDSQKRIVVGAKGSMLKQIGVSARKEIERVFNTTVYLDLWVKVRAKWRRDDVALRHVGYPL